MSGAEALELALGLLHAPARRELLANRPLPAGMTGLLAVAAGSLAAQLEASARTGATREELQEAARFFVQQVLLVPGADAYRTLGATADAPQSRLNVHHRLLQRWLHPDRDADHAWDSAFSARVNAAWSRVRTPQARAAYDAELGAEGVARATPAHESGTGPSPGPIPSPAPWRPAPAATGVPRPAPDSRVPAPPAASAPVRPATPPESPTVANPSRPRRVPVAAAAAVAFACAGLVWFALQRDAGPSRTAVPAIVAGPSPAATSEPWQPLETVHVVAAAPDVAAAPAGPLQPVAASEPPAPRPTTTLAAASAPTASAPLQDPAATAAGAPPPFPVPPAPLPVATTLAPPAPSQAALAAAVSVPDAPGLPPAPAATRAPEPPPAPLSAAAPTAHAAASKPAVTAPTVTAPTATAPTADPFVLYEEAEHTFAQLTAWMGSSEGLPPPIWNDTGTEAAAASARAALQQRGSARRPAKLAIDAPQWTLGSERAAVAGSYRVGSRRAGEQGRLQVELIRREERWLVTAVHVEPVP